jgi:phage shock protein PspC (stress-responsive transcriptional regulator)
VLAFGAGVCGGLAGWWGLDAVGGCLSFVLATMVWGLGAFAYVILWRWVPEVDRPTANPVRPMCTRSVGLLIGAAALVAAGALVLRSVGVLE